MLTRGTRRSVTVLAVALVLTAFPLAAEAAGPAAATISACKRDGITVAGKVALSGTSARRARGAGLQVRFQALPLFGLPHSGQWRALGKKTKASSTEAFGGLGADSWVGVMSWRFTKGRRTVLSGTERSQPVRVGSSKGRASCTIAEGLKPADTKAPALLILPADENWHHGPATVQLIATDDFSGVKSVRYGLDGGAKQQIGNGGTFTIPDQGKHTVDWEATDVAGNTATRSSVVFVDAGPPTKPAILKPPSVTVSPTPTFQWQASTDSGSGVGSYVLVISRADGTVVAFQTVGANTTSATSAATLNDGETYTAVVTAVDNTADTPWTAASDPLTFRVDKTPDVSSPQDDKVLAFGAKQAPVVVNFDRPVDPATKGGVTLTRDSGLGSDPRASGPTCSSPCTAISFTPTDSSGFPEGRYTLAVNVKSEEGVVMQKTIKFAVPDPNNEDQSGASTTQSCAVLPPTQPFSVTTRSGNETVIASFAYSLTSGTGRVRLIRPGDANPPSTSLSAGSGNANVLLTIPAAGTYALNLEYCIQSGSGTLSLSDLFVSRLP